MSVLSINESILVTAGSTRTASLNTFRRPSLSDCVIRTGGKRVF